MMGLVAAPEPEGVSHKAQGNPGQYRDRAPKVWPDYARPLTGAPRGREGNGQGVSPRIAFRLSTPRPQTYPWTKVMQMG